MHDIQSAAEVSKFLCVIVYMDSAKRYKHSCNKGKGENTYYLRCFFCALEVKYARGAVFCCQN